MNEDMIFEAKDIDTAIDEACAHFKVDREQLEVEIEEGGSSGIFGLVGVKKARIRARPRSNKLELERIIHSVVERLLQPLSQEHEIEIRMQETPIEVVIKDETNSGLIIGREGQTISALQYLVNRIVANQWQERVRIQLDVGDYREQQREQLKNQALFLARKAKESGRVQSTKAMTSYHRRVVHMALQDDEAVQTRSKGEGPMKRVLILPRRERPAKEADAAPE